MVESVQQNNTKFVLSFSSLHQNRKEPFTKEMEKATILCLAELERSKGGGLVLKHPPEKLDFVAKVCYPLWLIPLDGIDLLFDGLNTTSHTLTYRNIPDIQAFIDNMRSSCRTRRAYVAFLSDNLNYFQLSGNDEEEKIEGLVTDPDFLNEFTQWLTEAAAIKESLSDAVMVSPTLDKSLMTSLIEDLRNLKSKFEGEVDTLCKTMKLLNAETEKFLKSIRHQIEEIEEKSNEEIEKSRAYVAEKNEEIRREYDEEVAEHSKKAEEELLSLQQEKIKLEKVAEQFTEKVEHCEIEIKTSTIGKDDVGERKWKEQRNKLKEQLSETESKLKDLEERIKKVRDDEKLRIFELKSERDEKTKEAEKDLIEIESSRDAKIKIYTEEIEKLEELTSSVIEQIDELTKHREKSIDEFDKLGIPQKHEDHILIYVPFYLACYKSESEKRYVHFPPSIVKSVGLFVKFKGALGKAKVKHLLQPRSKKISSLLNMFPSLMEEDPLFHREMSEACGQVDLLRTKESRELVESGLEKLKEEGWISEDEYEAFGQELA
jgi:hypothetical protein